jgi:hypothetical protein
LQCDLKWKKMGLSRKCQRGIFFFILMLQIILWEIFDNE